MSPALITTAGVVVVGVLVFIAGRLDAGNRRKNLLVEAEILKALPEGSNAHAVMQSALDASVQNFASGERWRRKTRHERWMVVVLAIGAAAVMVIDQINEAFDLGGFEQVSEWLRSMVLSFMAGVLLTVIVTWLPDIWRGWRTNRAEVQRTDSEPKGSD